MSYSNFDLKKLINEFNLNHIDYIGSLDSIKTNISELCFYTIKENLPLATAIDTEKARSELLIFPMLLELKRSINKEISLFSGKEFTVDIELGLSGNPDFIVSLNKEQYFISAPVITLVEAKNQNINSGLGQCGAEMIAAQRFNQENNSNIKTIYGCVTTGVLWKFLSLVDNNLTIYSEEIPLNPLDNLLGIFKNILLNN